MVASRCIVRLYAYSRILSLEYSKQRVEVNQLKKFVFKVTTQAGLFDYTNHSLQATAVTRMYNSNSGVPEKVIADKSGHGSIEGLRAYEHPNEDVYTEQQKT